MKNRFVFPLLALTMAASTIAHAQEFNFAALTQQCDTYTSRYNAASGVRPITFRYVNVSGQEVERSLNTWVEGKGCTTNSSMAAFFITITGLGDSKFALMFEDEVGGVKISAQALECDTKMQSTFVTFYQEHGFAITSELNEQIKSAAVRYCDSLKAATKSTVITVLQGG